jgi:hypothetical protein
MVLLNIRLRVMYFSPSTRSKQRDSDASQRYALGIETQCGRSKFKKREIVHNQEGNVYTP